MYCYISYILYCYAPNAHTPLKGKTKEWTKKVEEKNKKLKNENKALCEYVQRLMRLFRREDRTFVPPSSLPKESVHGLEEIRSLNVLKNG